MHIFVSQCDTWGTHQQVHMSPQSAVAQNYMRKCQVTDVKYPTYWTQRSKKILNTPRKLSIFNADKNLSKYSDLTLIRSLVTSFIIATVDSRGVLQPEHPTYACSCEQRWVKTMNNQHQHRSMDFLSLVKYGWKIKPCLGTYKLIYFEW